MNSLEYFLVGYPAAIVAAAGTLVAIILFKMYLVGIARERAGANRKVVFMDLIVTCEDESYSLSRLQMYLWTVVVMMAFSAVFVVTRKFPEIPPYLCILMGINITTAVASTAITTAKDPKILFKGEPDFFKDIFFEADGSLDLPRTQMFGWTVINLVVFVVMVVLTFKRAGNNFVDIKLPDMTPGLVALMGVSQGAYLGTKAVARPDGK